MSRMKHIIASIMMAVLMFSMSGNCSYAKESDTSSHVLLEHGHTEEGIEYFIYSEGVKIQESAISPCIVVSEEVNLTQYYPKGSTPAATIQYSYVSTKYKTTMKGTLYLKDYAYNFKYDKVEAFYKGTVVGTI